MSIKMLKLIDHYDILNKPKQTTGLDFSMLRIVYVNIRIMMPLSRAERWFGMSCPPSASIPQAIPL